MKKFTKIFLVAAATLAMALSFTGCEDLLNAFFGQTGTIQIISGDSNVKGTKKVVIYRYGIDPESNPDTTSIDLTVDGTAKKCSDAIRAANYQRAKIGDKYVKAGTTGIPSDCLSVSPVDGDETLFMGMGGYSYVIKLYSDGTSYIYQKKSN